MTTAAQYTQAMEEAIFANPPRNNPAYATDPVAMWRYYMRNYGSGLAGLDHKEVDDIINSLYGRWFIRLEFNSHRPDIDAKEFFTWIRQARDEAETADRQRRQEREQ